MAVKVPPTGRPPIGARPAPRPLRGARDKPKLTPGAPDVGQDLPDPDDGLPLLPQVAKKVQSLNGKSSQEWTNDDSRELEELLEMLLAQTQKRGEQQHPQNVFAQKQSLEIAKMQLRSLFQSMEPPPELLAHFIRLWTRVQPLESFDKSSFARQTIMNAAVRRDVMNRQVEEAVDEADAHATQRRVEAIKREQDRGGNDQQQEASEPPVDAPRREHSFKQTVKQLRRKRREIGRDDVDDLAHKALDTMRAVRELIAPRWAPETQPWLLNTADTHVYQTVLAVIPESLLKESAAYQGIQNLRAGEHAFSWRAADKLAESARRSS